MVFGEKLSPDPYDHLDARTSMGARHGHQDGDPKKGAEAMYKLAIMKDPPLRAVLGSDAYAAMETVRLLFRLAFLRGGSLRGGRRVADEKDIGRFEED